MMQIPHDFPPVPKCFSHLLNAHSFYSENDCEDQTLSQSLPSRTLQELSNGLFTRSLSENSHPNASQPSEYDSGIPISAGACGNGNVFYQDVFLEDRCNSDAGSRTQQKLKAVLAQPTSFMSPRSQRRIMKQSSFDYEDDKFDKHVAHSEGKDLNNPFEKLNSSLGKLQKEMRELRLFDDSLFCQLLSLHESIQDIKLNINNDRYSETGSECSLGSASYMGSMSSLDEESDWGESQVFLQSFRADESAADDDENRQSTSSLLEQITALTLKAEEDI